MKPLSWTEPPPHKRPACPRQKKTSPILSGSGRRSASGDARPPRVARRHRPPRRLREQGRARCKRPPDPSAPEENRGREKDHPGGVDGLPHRSYRRMWTVRRSSRRQSGVHEIVRFFVRLGRRFLIDLVSGVPDDRAPRVRRADDDAAVAQPPPGCRARPAPQAVRAVWNLAAMSRGRRPPSGTSEESSPRPRRGRPTRPDRDVRILRSVSTAPPRSRDETGRLARPESRR